MPPGYTPTQIRHAYGFDTLSAQGAGQTVAIVDAYGSPTIAKDLATFSTKFGLPAATLTIAYPQGRPAKVDGGWALETALDVEWVHAIAPKAKILLVVAKDAYGSNMFPSVVYGATRAAQVSMSWGGGEFAGEGAALKQYFNRSGVAYVGSAGDSGGDPNIPSALSQVICVGGTTLNLNGAGTITSETGWDGSNGGKSIDIPRPAWQKLWNKTAMRECPDVSCVADPNTGVPVYSSTPWSPGQKGWVQVGGTSLSAPIVAAMMARVNSGRGSALTGVPAAVYSLGTPTAFKTYFRDITAGSNNSYSCKAGYDMVTGIGSPKANTLVPALISK
jgi:subtilase family serine protease